MLSMAPTVQQQFLSRMHLASFIRRFVIVSQEVQYAMRQQMEQLQLDVMAGFSGLLESRGK